MKPTITRTYGQIHFEDLDPHRFEDMIRQLIYDYKDWQSIEATGRSGSDEGFDIRAYERMGRDISVEDEVEEEQSHPMNGNLWMIQCKREKIIGPTSVKNIINETVDAQDSPYGYILAVSANVSKKTYDTFREELQNRGVMEFYVWGKAELEDMLYLPKNDRILFTFFGVSLVTKRKSRSTEVRSFITTKNKITGIFGGSNNLLAQVLIRDLNDENYPKEDEYQKFEKGPKWKVYTAFQLYPLGPLFHVHKYFAYIDVEKKEYDFTKEVDLEFRSSKHEDDEVSRKRFAIRRLVENNWELNRKSTQGYLVVNGIIRYRDIQALDPKGDSFYEMPHIYVDYIGESRPFGKLVSQLELAGESFNLADYKKTKIFPERFEKPRIGKIHLENPVIFDAQSLLIFMKDSDRIKALYAIDDKYKYLEKLDVVLLSGAETSHSDPVYLKITNIYTVGYGKYIAENRSDYFLSISIEYQVGKIPDNTDNVRVYEFKKIYKWEIDQLSQSEE